MKTILGLRAASAGRANLHAWLLEEASALANAPGVEKLVINLVGPQPDFFPTPPPNPAVPAQYDALIAIWTRSDPPGLTVLAGGAASMDRFTVEERVEKNELTESMGHVTQGIKNMPFIIYKSELSAAAGHAKWDAHAGLGLRIHTGMKRYVRNFVTAQSEAAPPIDGIAEVSFDSLEGLRTGLFPTPKDREDFLADVSGFVAANIAHYSTEHVVKW